MKKMLKICFTVAVVFFLVIICGAYARAYDLEARSWEELSSALSWAQDGDVVTVYGYIGLPLVTTYGYDEKHITIRRGDDSAYLVLLPESDGSAVKNLTFDGNRIDAGISFVYAHGSTQWTDCAFVNCGSSGDGGALNVVAGTQTFEKCVFENNHADRGGAIFITLNGGVSVRNCLFLDNQAVTQGTDAYINDFGTLTVNNTNDELKALYEARGRSYEGITDDATEQPIDIDAPISRKGIKFNSSSIQNEQSHNPEDQNGNQGDSGTGTNAGSTSNPYSAPITNNNTVNVNQTFGGDSMTPEADTDKQAQPSAPETGTGAPITGNQPVVATVTTGGGESARTYAANTDETGQDRLEISDGENTITINIHVGTGEAAAIAPETVTKSTDERRGVDWMEVVELFMIGGIVLYLIWRRLHRTGKRK